LYFGWGSPRTQLGELTAPVRPDSLAGFKGPTSKRRDGRGKKGHGRGRQGKRREGMEGEGNGGKKRGEEM